MPSSSIRFHCFKDNTSIRVASKRAYFTPLPRIHNALAERLHGHVNSSLVPGCIIRSGRPIPGHAATCGNALQGQRLHYSRGRHAPSSGTLVNVSDRRNFGHFHQRHYCPPQRAVTRPRVVMRRRDAPQPKRCLPVNWQKEKQTAFCGYACGWGLLY